MNTPAHALINLALLSRDPSHRKSGMIVAGAVIPDLVIIVFYAWHLMLGTSESQIWSVEYYHPFWQGWIDSFNSIPLILIGLLVGWKLRQPLLIALFASLFLHTLGDLPLHHDDGHRHFFPLLDWRFESPVSYWDPNHHGQLASVVEASIAAIAAFLLYRFHPSFRPWVIGLSLIFAVYWIYVFIVWI